MVDGDAVDGDEHVFGLFTKRPGEVKYVLDGGWLSVEVVNGWYEWKPIGCENVNVM